MGVPIKKLQLYVEEHDNLREQYVDFQGYYDGGDQEARLNDRTREFLEVNGFVDFRANVCQVIIDAEAHRLMVTNFASPDDFDDWAWFVWQRSGLSAIQYMLYQMALVMGDAYLVGEWYTDPLSGLSYPRFRFVSAYNCYMVYDEDDVDKQICFMKRWQRRGVTASSPGEWRMNVYYPDTIEKYQGTYQEGSEGVQWKLLESNQWAAGVIPAVHFRNRRAERAFGHSELVNIVPMQDALNKYFVDLAVVLDQQGWPQRWAIGAREPEGGFSSAPGMVWNLPAAEGQFGQFAAANPIGILKGIETTLSMTASISRTPQHLFHSPGDRFPSGEALKTAEAGLIEKCGVFTQSAGTDWEACMRIAARMEKVFGNDWPPRRPGAEIRAERERYAKQLKEAVEPDPVNEQYSFDLDSMIECQWRGLETRNELMEVQTINLKGDVISKRQRLREYGYSDDEVARILREKAEEIAQATPPQLQNQQPSDSDQQPPSDGQQPQQSAPLSQRAIVQPALSTAGQNQPTQQKERGSGGS